MYNEKSAALYRHISSGTNVNFLWDYLDPDSDDATPEVIQDLLKRERDWLLLLEPKQAPGCVIAAAAVGFESFTDVDVYILPIRTPSWMLVYTHEGYGPFYLPEVQQFS